MKITKGYTLVGMAILVSLLTLVTIAMMNQLITGSKAAKEITDTEVTYTQSRTETILAKIRDSRGG